MSRQSRDGGIVIPSKSRNRITTKVGFCHSEHRRCEESMLLSKHNFFLRCAGVTFGGKSNQNRGGCDSPTPHKRRTSVVCYVCYKSRKFETSFALLTRSTNFYVIFVKIFQPAYALEIFLLSADSAINTRGKAPNPSNFAKAALPSLRNWGAVRWAVFSRKVYLSVR